MLGPTDRIISASYFSALGLPMASGRDFTVAEEQATNAPSVAIIDTVLAN